MFQEILSNSHYYYLSTSLSVFSFRLPVSATASWQSLCYLMQLIAVWFQTSRKPTWTLCYAQGWSLQDRYLLLHRIWIKEERTSTEEQWTLLDDLYNLWIFIVRIKYSLCKLTCKNYCHFEIFMFTGELPCPLE